MTTYNFREYAQRRTRDAFREHVNERDPARVREFLAKGKTELEMLRRQAIVSGFFTFDKLVVEKNVRLPSPWTSGVGGMSGGDVVADWSGIGQGAEVEVARDEVGFSSLGLGRVVWDGANRCRSPSA